MRFPGSSACRAQSLLLSERLSNSLLGRTSDYGSEEAAPPPHREVSRPAAIWGVGAVSGSICLRTPPVKAHQIARGAPWKLKAADSRRQQKRAHGRTDRRQWMRRPLVRC